LKLKFSELSVIEVIRYLEDHVGEVNDKLLKKAEDSWQPGDILPDAGKEGFYEEVKNLQSSAEGLSYELFAVLVGDTITEEALPTYESWLYTVDGMKEMNYFGNWGKWIRGWTAEENRHGDLLNKYLYLSGRVNMREMEVSTHYLIADGFDIKTGSDPYRSFVYTSFQELATNLSHRRVGTIAKQQGDPFLAKICGLVAADEQRHAKAYMSFITKIFELDPSNMMIAFADMMKKKIVMPAHFLRETGVEIGKTFGHFTDAAQRLEVYTAKDYVDILVSLIKKWDIEHKKHLNEAAEKARDYILTLPGRLTRVIERMKIPELEYKFKWIS
jgi:acyl-[acyl-carrier-protein] desaturase